MAEKAPRPILVTGGNDGIGLALCRQLVVDHECHVFLTSRSIERGRAAVESIRTTMSEQAAGRIEGVQLDVTDPRAIAAAVRSVQTSLGEGSRLYGLVNNAGVGLATATSPQEVIETNLLGVKRVNEAFLSADLVSDRVVHVGSGSGPSYVQRCPPEAQDALCRYPESWAAIEMLLARSPDGRTGFGSAADSNGGYGLSKAMLTLYTMLCAREHPELLWSCVSPGWIRTKLVGHDGPSKGPEEGTASILHGVFGELGGNGWYYGSDCLRSPLHYMRNPGEPAYEGP